MTVAIKTDADSRFNHLTQCYEYPDKTVAAIELFDAKPFTLLDLFWVLSVRERQKTKGFPQYQKHQNTGKIEFLGE